MPDNVNETAASRPKKQASSKEQTQKQQRILLVLIILVIIGGAIILYRNGVIGGNASRQPVEDYLNAIAAKDFEGYVATMPEDIAQGYRSEMNELGLSGEDYMRRLYDDYFTEFGEDLSVSVEITGRSRPESQYVDNFKQSYLDIYGREIKISSVFEVDATAHFSGEKSQDDIELECFVIKTEGRWAMAGCDYKTEDADSAEE